MAMPRRIAAALSLGAVVAVVVSGPAEAKGPSQAVIEGPGIEQPILLRAPGSDTIGLDLGALIMSSGFFPEICRPCDERLHRQPETDLGPRYEVTYVMSGARRDRVTQYVYPFARPHPVTYMPDGQAVWGHRTAGGWFVANNTLRRGLLRLGVPEPATPIPWTDPVAHHPTVTEISIAALAVLIVLAAALWLLVPRLHDRRRTAAPSRARA